MKHDFVLFRNVRQIGFQVKKEGKFKINIQFFIKMFTGDIEALELIWWINKEWGKVELDKFNKFGLEYDWSDIIEKKVNGNGLYIFEKRIERKFPLDTPFAIVPGIAQYPSKFFFYRRR